MHFGLVENTSNFVVVWLEGSEVTQRKKIYSSSVFDVVLTWLVLGPLRSILYGIRGFWEPAGSWLVHVNATSWATTKKRPELRGNVLHPASAIDFFHTPSDPRASKSKSLAALRCVKKDTALRNLVLCALPVYLLARARPPRFAPACRIRAARSCLQKKIYRKSL
jgi:hypothetical protein